MATKCDKSGLTKNGRLRKGFRYAKGRKACPLKVKAKGKGKPWSKARKMKYGKTEHVSRATTVMLGRPRRRSR